MSRRVAAITGSRSDYALMSSLFRRLHEAADLALHLVITGAHFLSEFRDSLAQIETDNFGVHHRVSMTLGEDSGKAMAQSLGLGIYSVAQALQEIRPDILLLQGDRGEMLAGAIAAAHMNLPIVHMSGGDMTGSIDDSIRNAISKFAHIHLTNCHESSERLLAMDETENRIVNVGEPAVDVIHEMDFIPIADLARELRLDLTAPFIIATQHPVTTEADDSGRQMAETLEALRNVNLPTIITYPNNDAGSADMIRVIESCRSHGNFRVVPHLGSRKYLSLLQAASVLVGNSSSGIVEAPSFKRAAVNIGSRQHKRMRGCNVLDAPHQREQIIEAINFALNNRAFHERLQTCVNPYGDGHAAERTLSVLRTLSITPALIAKWTRSDQIFCQMVQ